MQKQPVPNTGRVLWVGSSHIQRTSSLWDQGRGTLLTNTLTQLLKNVPSPVTSAMNSCDQSASL